MRKGSRFLERLAGEGELSSELLPGRSIVEIAGDSRVLIEHHFGVKAYSLEQIVVSVSYGSVCVCGQCLDILRMSKEQMVIQGKIHSVSLQRRK